VFPRSFLYVPAVRPELFAKAAGGPADAVVLDLEDAVPLADKATARAAVRGWLSQEGSDAASAQVWVRVNASEVGADLDAVVRPGLSGLFLATCTRAVLEEAADVLERLEPARQLAPGGVRIVGLVESAAAMLDLAAMAAHPRLDAFGIGEVDLLGDLRVARGPRSEPAIVALRTQVVVHSAAAGLEAPVAPTSTDFRDLEAFAESTLTMLDLGFRSRTAIHPAQVPVIHQVLAPTPEQVEAAQDVVRRFEAADGGITTDASGRLIDAAVVRGARETLDRHRA
jgi:citrate lyase subunit beta/citryl-CoA lyase